MCGGIYPDKTALCRHRLSGYSGCEGIADWKREEFIMNVILIMKVDIVMVNVLSSLMMV